MMNTIVRYFGDLIDSVLSTANSVTIFYSLMRSLCLVDEVVSPAVVISVLYDYSMVLSDQLDEYLPRNHSANALNHSYHIYWV